MRAFSLANAFAFDFDLIALRSESIKRGFAVDNSFIVINSKSDSVPPFPSEVSL